LTFRAVTGPVPSRAATHTKGTGPMNDYETLNHTTWDCKYHIVFIPKRRRKVLYQELRGISGKSSVNSRPRRSRRSRKGICFQITCICCFPFHRSMRWRKWSDTSKARALSSGPHGPARTESEAGFRRAAVLGSRIFREDVSLDFAFAESCLVSAQTEAPQPIPDVHDRPSIDCRRSWSWRQPKSRT
jgi:hypothetical protein